MVEQYSSKILILVQIQKRINFICWSRDRLRIFFFALLFFWGKEECSSLAALIPLWGRIGRVVVTYYPPLL